LKIKEHSRKERKELRHTNNDGRTGDSRCRGNRKEEARLEAGVRFAGRINDADLRAPAPKKGVRNGARGYPQRNGGTRPNDPRRERGKKKKGLTKKSSERPKIKVAVRKGGGKRYKLNTRGFEGEKESLINVERKGKDKTENFKGGITTYFDAEFGVDATDQQ